MSSLFQTLINGVKHWYIPMIFGIIFLICGFYTLSVPLETYLTLTIIFSVTFLVSGIAEIFFSLQNRDSLLGWGWYLVDGILSTLVGIYLVANPEVSMATLPFVVGFVMMFRAFQLLGFAFEMKQAKMLNWGNLALVSVLGIILSFLLLSSPIFTSLSLVVLTATSLIFTGIASILLSLNLKKLNDAPEKMDYNLKKRIADLEQEINQTRF
ncbi:MAG: DUF308 domain-containing protein [Saprospiraceae bacterium]